ncbi:MAG TPA: glycosyltransferase [Devosia sp.]
MRVAIQTLGTRGDVQPYVALAKGLMARGHEVQLAGPTQYQDLSGQHGVAYHGLPAEFLNLLETPEGKAAIAGGSGFSGGFKLLKHIRPMMRALFDAEWDGARSFAPELIVYHPKSLASPYLAAELDVPMLLASPLPGFTPTSAFPSPILPFASLGPLNRASHWLMSGSAQMMFGKDMRAWQREAMGRELKPRKAAGTLYAYSRHLIPVPSDWGDDVAVTGYWFLDQPEWQPDAALTDFLAAGEKPIYVGFGSMPGLDPVELSLTVAEALAVCGKRGVLLRGGGALADVGAAAGHVHVIDSAPHEKLLPLMAAAIHHGGAGTTGAALRAGLPNAICPFFGDQPFWARRVAELGAGPPALDRKSLSVASLSAAIRAMDDPTMRRRAADIGEAIREEDGVERAVAFIEKQARQN